MYKQEGAKPQDIVRVFRKEFAMDPDDLSLDFVEPFVTQHLAKDLRNCMFDYDGTLTYENCNRGLVPLAVIPKSSEERSAILDKEELYDEINVRTEAVVRARSQRCLRPTPAS
jgi:hypothetical protein